MSVLDDEITVIDQIDRNQLFVDKLVRRLHETFSWRLNLSKTEEYASYQGHKIRCTGTLSNIFSEFGMHLSYSSRDLFNEVKKPVSSTTFARIKSTPRRFKVDDAVINGLFTTLEVYLNGTDLRGGSIASTYDVKLVWVPRTSFPEFNTMMDSDEWEDYAWIIVSKEFREARPDVCDKLQQMCRRNIFTNYHTTYSFRIYEHAK